MRAAGARAQAFLGAVLLLGSASAGRTSDVPTAEDLIQRVAAAWDPVRVSLKATMTVERPNRPASTTELLIRRAGHLKTRIDFLSPPRDRGKVILENGSETWLYLPRADRVVEVPARRNPLAGGILFEDLFPGGTGAGVLQRGTSGTPAAVEEHDEGFVLVTAGRSGSKQPNSRIYFDRSTLFLFRREVYASSGRLLKTIHIDESRDWQGVQIPWKVRFVDHLRYGANVRIEILEALELEGDLDEIFSKDRLRPAAAADSPEGS